MNPFKFFNGDVHDGTPSHNGVTDPFLIQLSEDIFDYCDWVYSCTLSIDDERNQDSLIL